MTVAVACLAFAALVAAGFGGARFIRWLERGQYVARALWACRCGHTWDGHRHYKPSTPCRLCACTQFRYKPPPSLDEADEALAIVRPGCGCAWRSGVFHACPEHDPRRIHDWRAWESEMQL